MNGTTTPGEHEPRNRFKQRARAAIRRSVTIVGARADARVPRFRAALTRGLTIFVFNEVTDTPSPFQTASSGFMSLDVFRRQIRWIATASRSSRRPRCPSSEGLTRYRIMRLYSHSTTLGRVCFGTRSRSFMRRGSAPGYLFAQHGHCAGRSRPERR